MKTQSITKPRRKRFVSALLAVVLLTLLALRGMQAASVGTAFSYQGRLDQNGQPTPNGLYGLSFALYDLASAGNFLGTNLLVVPVSNGLFTTSLDFGATAFAGDARWLEVGVNTNTVGAIPQYQILLPRTRITPTPYAIFASTAGTVSPGAVTDAGIQDSTITAAKVAANEVVKSFNGLKDNVSLVAGANVTLTPSGNTLTLSAAGVGGSGLWSALNNNAYYNAGKVGIGTAAPLASLDVLGDWDGEQGALNLFGDRPSIRLTGGAGSANRSWLMHLGGTPGDLLFYRRTGVEAWVPTLSLGAANGTLKAGGVLVADTFDYANPGSNDLIVKGKVGIGTATPSAPMNIETDWDADSADGVPNIDLTGPKPTLMWSKSVVPFTWNWVTHMGNVSPGNFTFYHRTRRQFPYPPTDTQYQPVIDLQDDLNVKIYKNLSVCSLTIRGGCDVAEPFQMSTKEIPKGAVVVIDAENAGQLRLSDRAYDRRVAGIVSGANGINPGIALHQEGAFEGGQNVALSGRVYVLAEASSSPIEPGDLLTTSSTPGHAMKVTDHAQAQGAILGKAMSVLKEGKGMVLVLVTLQ